MSRPRFWTLSSNTLYLHGIFYLSKEIHRCILLHISRGSLSCMFFVISKCILCWLLTVSTQHYPCPLNSSCIHRSRKPKDYISQILVRQASSFDSTNERHSREIWKVEEKQKPWSIRWKWKLQRQHVKRKKLRIEASETLLLKTRRKLQGRLGSSWQIQSN